VDSGGLALLEEKSADLEVERLGQALQTGFGKHEDFV